MIRNFALANYLKPMRKSSFEPCIPTRGTKVPAGKDWLHEIKHDGYRLIVQREGDCVRLFTRNGHDWTNRYPLIVEAALRNRSRSFVVDGEAVLLGVDGISDSTPCIPASMTMKSSCTPSTFSPSRAMTFASCRFRCARPTSRAYWRGGRKASSSMISSRERLVRICSGRPAISASRAWSRSERAAPIAPADRRTGSR
jgi:hypothetical protein